MIKKNGILSLKVNVILNYIYEIFLIVLPFITGPYLSRVLHADGVGTESYLSSLLSYFTMFAVLGTVSYGSYSIARERDDKDNLSKTFWEIEVLSLITSGLMILAWCVFAFFYKQYSLLMYIQTFNLVGTALSVNWLFAGLEKYQYNIIISTLIRISSVISVFCFVKTPDDLVIHIIINSLATFLSAASLWVFVPKFVSKCKISIKNVFGVRLKETFVYFIPTIAISIYTVLDKSLIGIITKDAFQNGYYEQATKILHMAKTVSFTAIHGVMLTRSSFYFKCREDVRARELAVQDLKIISFLSVGAAFGIIVIAKDFVPMFFGDGYEPTIYILYVLSLIIPVIGLSNAYGSIYYTPSGRIMQSTWYLLIGSASNLVLNILLIPSIGAYGAAIATIIAETIITLLFMINARHFLSIKTVFDIYWKKIVAGVLMLLSCMLINSLISGLDIAIVKIILFVIAGVSIYLLVLMLLRDCSVKLGIEYLKLKIREKK